MSAPAKFQQDAEIIKLGFLADRTKATLQKLLDNAPLDQGDIEILEKASEFLDEISDGAEIVTSGTVHNANANQSLVAVDFAIRLLEALPNLVADNEELSACFTKLSSAISDRDPLERDSIESARDFFSEFSSKLILTNKEEGFLTASSY